MRSGRAAPALLLAMAAACSSPEDTGPSPATNDEQRALAEAKAMIPAEELPPATPTPVETAKNDQ